MTEKTHGLPRGSSVLASSDDAEYSHLRNEVNMGCKFWSPFAANKADSELGFIAHSPSTQTLTLTLSSLPTVDDLLEFLSVDALDDKVFVDLSPDYFAHNSTASVPQIYHTFDQAFDVHGKSALYALEQIIAEPPQSDSPVAAFLPKQLRPLVEWFYPSNPPIAHVDIVGHGLGGVVGLLVSLALSKSSPEMPITSTLFSLPRMGNPAFAAWVDDKMDSKFQVYRVVSYADTIPHVPAEHLGVAHPKKGEVWVGADPRTAYACNSAGSSTAICSASVAFSRTSLVDHNGPFGGIWIQDGTECGIGFNVAKTL